MVSTFKTTIVVGTIKIKASNNEKERNYDKQFPTQKQLPNSFINICLYEKPS